MLLYYIHKLQRQKHVFQSQMFTARILNNRNGQHEVDDSVAKPTIGWVAKSLARHLNTHNR